MTAPHAAVTLDTLLVRSPHAMHQTVGSEAVLLDLGSEAYFGLNALALRVWEALDGVTPLKNLVETFAPEYDVDPARLAEDILSLADQLLDEGLALAASSP